MNKGELTVPIPNSKGEIFLYSTVFIFKILCICLIYILPFIQELKITLPPNYSLKSLGWENDLLKVIQWVSVAERLELDVPSNPVP